MITIRKLIPLLLAVIPIVGHAQQSAPSTPGANGTAANNGTSPGSIYNVSLYDGTASIHIPVYAYSVDGLDLGVSLNYDTRGIQLDQTAGTAGLGWNVNPAYSITRQVNDLPDEMKFPSLHYKANTPNGFGGFFDTVLQGPTGMRQGTWSYDNDYDNEQNQDIFYLSLPGRSLRFCNPTGSTYQVFPKSEITINGGISPGFAFNARTDTTGHVSFVIYDEKGNQFTFDRIDYEKHWMSDPNARDNYEYRQTSKWLLTKIFTYTGQLILYHYTTVYNISLPQYREQKVLEEIEHSEIFPANVYSNHHYLSSIKALVDSNVMWNGTISYLTDIAYPNGTTVYFNYETDPSKPRCDISNGKVLKSIKVQSGYDANTTNALTYSFNYAYFHSPSSVAATELAYGTACNNIGTVGTIIPRPQDPQLGLRLKLKSIDKVGTDNTTKEQYYSFDYNSTPLPQRLYPSKDYYGYYNGHTSLYFHTGQNIDSGNLQALAIPLHTFTLNGGGITYSYGLDRTADFTYMQACNLTHIVNGMGGSVDLYYKMHQLYNPDNAYSDHDYAANRAMDQDGQNTPDGLCIDSIVVKDGYNTDNTTSMKYVFDHGERFFRGGYFWDPKYYEYQNDSLVVYAQYYFNDFINPMQFINGSNHGYSFATVKNYGYNNQFLGSTKYQFSNLMTEADTSVSNLKVLSYFNKDGIVHGNILYHRFHPVYMNEYKMGLALQTLSYDRNGDIVSQVQNTYVDSGKDFAVTMPWKPTAYNQGNQSMDAAYDQYKPFIITKSLLKTAATTASSNGQYSHTTLTNDFDSKDNITTVRWQDSKGDNYRKEYGYGGYSGQHLTSSRIVKEVPGNEVTVSAHSSSAPFNVLGGGGGYYDFHSLKLAAPVAGPPAWNNSTRDKDHHFDAHANPIETIYENGVSNDAAIWDTRIGQKVADVSNALNADIAYTSFEGSFKPFGTPDDKGNWDFDPSHIEYGAGSFGGSPMTGHYTYNLVPGATIRSINTLQTDRTYKLSFWGYGTARVTMGGQVIPLVTVDNIQGWSLYTATFTGTGNPVQLDFIVGAVHIDELRLYPAEATMTTRTYEPLLGVGSTCDGRNDIVYYEYDAMGRVKVVRDIERNIISLTKQTVQGADY